ncbi:hypothetical protein [Nitratireductor sp. StC3]|uniref:hypothetical protein n=1 Tax=Nitratireductor sp. StC3 TaxID=2126741 RepID=UPI0011B1FD9D|nr:hypothetical protein [Nitratireductor sp. StC3]
MESETIGWLVFIERVVGHIAWPAAILASGILFKSQIVRALGRLKSIRHKDTEVTFSDLLDEASQEAALLPAPTNPPELPVLLEQKLISDFPHLAISEAWRRIENRIAMIVSSEWPRLPEREFHGMAGIKNLQRLEVVESGVLRLLNDLRRVRNEAVHSWDGDITEGQAQEFVALAARVESELEKAKQKVPKID